MKNPITQIQPYSQMQLDSDIFLDNNNRVYYLNNIGEIVPTIETLKYYNPNTKIGNKLDTNLKGAVVNKNNLKLIKSGTTVYQKNDGSISLNPGTEKVLKDSDLAVEFQKNIKRQQSDKPLGLVYPEFDIISLAQSGKDIVNLFKKSLMKKSYVGVPARIDNKTGKLMTEQFDTYNGNIWTTTDKGFAQTFADGGSEPGKVFTIFGNTRKLAKTPKTSHMIMWQHMPYKFKNGKFIIDPNAKTALNPRYLKTFNGDEHNLLTITDKGLADLDLLNIVPQKTTSTDDLFKLATSHGYNGIKFQNVYDGPHIINGEYFDLPTTEFVYKNAEGLLKFDKDITKLDLLRPHIEGVIRSPFNIWLNHKLKHE